MIKAFTLHSHLLKLDQERKTLAIFEGEQHVELPRADVAQMMAFLMVHPEFFEDQAKPVHKPVASLVPRFAALLECGIFAPDASNNRLLMGMQVSTGEPYWTTWQDFRSGAVGGRGRSGKTNTLLFLIMQAILSSMEVWIIDPHYNKAASLTTFLRPLAKYMRLAGTANEVELMIHDWDEEMDRRKAEPGPHRPMVVICDEWNILLNLFDLEAEEAGVQGSWSFALVTSAIKCLREMAGYEMHLLLGVNDWSDRAIGGAVLRCLIHRILCHRMSAEYSRHILESKQWASQTEGLRTGYGIFRDNEGSYTQLVVPCTSVEDAVALAHLLGNGE